jgi:hypothetical protein
MACNILGINLYQKYSRQILVGLGVFVLVVIALYIALALIGLN